MPYKLCQACHQASYSASGDGIWICPYCGNELTFNQALADTRLPSKCFKTPKSLQQYGQNIGRLHILSSPAVSQTLKPR